MLTDEEKKSLEDICWAIVYADISFSALLRRMLSIHGNLEGCPQKVKDGYLSVREAQRMMGEIVKAYNLGTNGSYISLLDAGAEEMYPNKSCTPQTRKRRTKRNAPSGGSDT